MRFRRQLIFLLFVFAISGVWVGVCFGQAAEKARPGEVDRTRFDELRSQGYEALYNLDYEEANHLFTEMARLFPEHPAGPQCLAATLWLQELNRSRHLQAALYSTESFSKSEDKVDPRMVEQFRQWTRTATILAKARLRRDPRDVEALYFLGVTEGLKAVFAAAVERRFTAALGDSSSAVERHRQVLKLDPNFHDAELSIGMHNYIIGSLPLPLKLIASIGGMRGSKKRGLETLERVAREGRWAQGIARLLLIDLYKREKRWTEAIALAQELGARYPRNYLFQLQVADALIARAATVLRAKGGSESAARADQQEAFRIFESLLRNRAAGVSKGRDAASDLIHYRYGEALLMTGQPARAAEEFLAAKGQGGAQTSLTTMARLRAAQSMDMAGRRREALAEYRAVLERPKFDRSHEEARRGLSEPYRKSSDNKKDE
jgi:tetratricopeptide (TPR) repeat protein